MMLASFPSDASLISPRIAGMHIVALAAGYIDAPPAELVMAPRKQVLVAVTSSWQVLCLDHNLKLRWETTILVCSNICTECQAPSCDLKLPDVHWRTGPSSVVISDCLLAVRDSLLSVQ